MVAGHWSHWSHWSHWYMSKSKFVAAAHWIKPTAYPVFRNSPQLLRRLGSILNKSRRKPMTKKWGKAYTMSHICHIYVTCMSHICHTHIYTHIYIYIYINHMSSQTHSKTQCPQFTPPWPAGSSLTSADPAAPGKKPDTAVTDKLPTSRRTGGEEKIG